MKLSKLFGKPSKDIIKFDSRSHELLIKAGFIDQLASGLYNILPLGKKVLTNIEKIIREEMENIDAQEIQMPLLHPKANWETSGRWSIYEDLYKTKSNYGEAEYGIAPTHEEIVTPLVKKFVKSHKDLPIYLYHITEKFRDEPRPKSGILRGREFGMKDLYSFHANHDDLMSYYEKAKKAYLKIFARCGLNNIKITEASGGTFTKKIAHEFNVITPAGEVDLIYCDSCDFAQNEEISKLKKGDKCPKCDGELKFDRAIEVGNIFDLGTRFSESFNLKYTDEKAKENLVYMGCYGIGTSRLIGAIVEAFNDQNGIMWPKEISPYQAQLVNLSKDSSYSDLIYRTLVADGFSILYDDRNTSFGEKLKTVDLIGTPIRLVISDKTGQKIEIKKRDEQKSLLFELSEIKNILTEYYAKN